MSTVPTKRDEWGYHRCTDGTTPICLAPCWWRLRFIAGERLPYPRVECKTPGWGDKKACDDFTTDAPAWFK